MTELKQDKSLAANEPTATRGTGGSKGRGKTSGRKTKKQELIRLLGRKTGADVARLSDKLGWQPHSVRAAQIGLCKDGHDLQRDPGQSGKPSRYRILPSLVSVQVCGAEVGK